MNTKMLIRISEMILLAIAVSLIALALVYTIQNFHLMGLLATVSWNG